MQGEKISFLKLSVYTMVGENNSLPQLYIGCFYLVLVLSKSTYLVRYFTTGCLLPAMSICTRKERDSHWFFRHHGCSVWRRSLPPWILPSCRSGNNKHKVDISPSLCVCLSLSVPFDLHPLTSANATVRLNLIHLSAWWYCSNTIAGFERKEFVSTF